MVYFLFWFALSIAAGMFATQRGRGSGNWFLVSLLLSPLIGFIFLLVLENLRVVGQPADNATRVKCPACAEFVLPEASVCKHCGGALVPDMNYAKNRADDRAHAASQAQTASRIKIGTAMAAFAFFIYIWVERHGGGW